MEETVRNKRRANLWFCASCCKDLEGDVILCDACLKWYHFHCASITSKTKIGTVEIVANKCSNFFLLYSQSKSSLSVFRDKNEPRSASTPGSPRISKSSRCRDYKRENAVPVAGIDPKFKPVPLPGLIAIKRRSRCRDSSHSV